MGALAVAALLRAPDLGAAWPYINYVDEGHLLRPAAVALRAGSWDTGDFNYPTLPAYLAAGTVALAAGLRGEPALPPRGLYEQRYYDVTPPALLLGGRLWSFALSLGTVLVLGLLARTLADPATGWLTAWLVAVLPALVIRGGNANVDIVATFFAALAFLAAERAAVSEARATGGWIDPALAGLAAGLATTSKYTMAIVLPCVGLRLLLGEGNGGRKGRLLALVALAGAVGLALGMPALVLAPGRVWEGVATQSSRYRDIDLGRLWDQAVRHAEWNHPFAGAEVGYLFLALVALGGWRLAKQRRGRAVLLVLAIFTLALLVPLMAYAFRPFRNLLPAVALACPLAGLALSGLAARWRWRGSIVVACLCLLLLYGPSVGSYAWSRLRLRDSRQEAVDWLAAHARAGARVCVARELAVLPSELARLGEGALFVPALDARFEKDWAACTFALRPAKALGEAALCPPGPAAPASVCFEEVHRFGETAVHLDPSLDRGNRQRIHLLRRRDPS